MDKVTKTPIPFANVFINNSSIGTVTNASGEFTLSNLNQPFVYELIISFVGYESANIKISVADFEVKLGIIFLDNSDVSLSDVTVTAKKDNRWEKDLKRFKRTFLGIDEFSKGCIILNPWVIDFSTDEKDNGLIAVASSPIEIENKMLGYKVHFDLKEFKSAGDDYLIVGNTQFEELSPDNPSDLITWFNNRERAYRLSRQHLFRAMIEKKIHAEGFLLNQVAATGLSSNVPFDTLQLVTPTPQAGIYMISFKGPMEISYRKKVTFGTLITAGWIELKKGFILVNKEGFEINPTGVVTSGKLNHYRVASLLPINYIPENSIENSSQKEQDLPLSNLFEKIYIHTDKPYYYPGEKLWFKGYINYLEPNLRESLSKTIYVELIDLKSKSIFQSRVIRIDSGLFAGDFVLPDTLKTNTYYLRAYTNLNRNFGDGKLYVKPIPILYIMDRVNPQEARYSEKKSDYLSITADKQEYKPRERITLEIQTRNNDTPISGNLSVSVTDAEQIIPVAEERDIINSYQIDEVFDAKKKNYSHPVERGISFLGQFFNDNNKPKKAKLDIIQLSPRNLFQLETDENGIFTLSDLYFTDTSLFTYKPKGKSKQPSGKIIFQNRAQPKIEFAEQLVKFRILFTDSMQRPVNYDSLSKGTKLLNELVVTGKKFNMPIQVGTLSTYLIEGSEIKGGNIFTNLMQIPRLRVIISEGLISYIGRAGDPSPNLQVYIDGILSTNPATSPVDALYHVNTESILYVTVSPGAISVTTKPVWMDDGKKFQILKLMGYSVPSSFQNIDYSNPITEKKNGQDMRSTIYWNPYVITAGDSGKCKVSFFSADLPGRYRIVIEGITEDGKPVRTESYVNVVDE